MKKAIYIPLSIVIAILLAIGWLFLRLEINALNAQNDWKSRSDTKIEEFGMLSQVTITVLAGPLGDDEVLITEPGLSLLIETDDRTWLYDYGLNAQDGQKTVQYNAEALGIDLSLVETVFLSHRHRDHMGGRKAEATGRMNLKAIGVSSNSVTVFSPPDALAMPDRSVSEIHAPSVIGEGIASLGPIRRALFIGPVDEQAMVLDIHDYGLVLIVGCGHQTLPKLVARMEEVFGRQPRAIVGDLHYPVPNGRLSLVGIDAQKRLASGEGPLHPIGDAEVLVLEKYVSEYQIELYLVGHDTHDNVLSLPFVQPISIGHSIKFGNYP